MEYGCPVCNGIILPKRQCPDCGEEMKDGGTIEDYYGPYSPYDKKEHYEKPEVWEMKDGGACVHLFSCPECGYDERVGFGQVVLS